MILKESIFVKIIHNFEGGEADRQLKSEQGKGRKREVIL